MPFLKFIFENFEDIDQFSCPKLTNCCVKVEDLIACINTNNRHLNALP